MNLNNFKNYFVFRAKYFLRLLNNDLDKVIIYIVFWLLIYFYDFQYEWFYLIYYLIPPLYYHTNRKDISFINKISNNKSYFFIASEYLLFNVFTLFIIYSKTDQKLIQIIGLLISLFIPIIKIKNVQWTKKLTLKFIPIDAYEWKAFIRQKPISFLFTYVLFVISSYHPFSLGIMTFMFCGTINSVYSTTEPKEVYCLYFTNRNIDNKVFNSLKFLLKITLPIFILCSIVNASLLYIILLVYCFLFMFHTEIILRKYANYFLDFTKNKPTDSMKIIEIIFSIILVIPWVLNYRQLKKESTLKINNNVRS